MKAFLINPFDQTITEVDYNGDYREIYKLIDCQMFTVARLKDWDGIYVDEEGLFRDLSTQMFFSLPTMLPHQPYAGKGLVLGTDADGDSTSPRITLEELKEEIKFLTPQQVADLF